MRLQGALDNEIRVATQRFIADGITPDVNDIFQALQRSNSSLKRRPKKIIQASIERVLEYLVEQNIEDDSDAVIEESLRGQDQDSDIMNRSLRANLTSQPSPVMGGNSSAQNGDETIGKRKPNGEALPKRQKRETDQISTSAPTDVSLWDVGGMDEVIKQMNDLIIMPLGMPEAFCESKISPPRGILLHGPPGCGKTMLARAYAALVGVPFIEMMGPSIVSGMSGESEKGIRDRFEEAKKNAPSLIFIDEIDAIAPKRESSGSQMEKRIVAQLLVSMDELQKDPTKPVIVLAATNRPDSIDPALRRGGRFGKEINITVPNEEARQRILKTQTQEMELSSDVDFAKLAKMTAGFVGADLHHLVDEAGIHNMKRFRAALRSQSVELGLYEQRTPGKSDAINEAFQLAARFKRKDISWPTGFEKIALSMNDFLAVFPGIIPSSKREGFSTIPDVTWDDVGALQTVRQELQSAIVNKISQPKIYEDLGETSSAGVLLYGPPGCGKSLLAKAVAAESKANFITIKGPELLNKFVGESEAAVRKLFQRARSSVPCIIFFDELDALVPRREDSGSEASARVVNTLLTELDGVGQRAGIHVIGATNRPDMIDEAMLRPGRFGTPIFVDIPGPEERVSILKALTAKRPMDFTPAIGNIARNAINFTGADLGSLLSQAVMRAAERRSARMDDEDFEWAAKRVKPSVIDLKRYRELKKRMEQLMK